MAKRTASMKPKKDDRAITDERTPEEYFDEAKAGLLAIVESYDKNATRPDKVISEILNLKQFKYCYDDEKLAMDMIKARKDAYNKIAARLTYMTFEKITADDWEDPFADMLEYIDDVPEFPDLMRKWARFDSVRPFGEKVEQLRITLLEQLDK